MVDDLTFDDAAIDEAPADDAPTDDSAIDESGVDGVAAPYDPPASTDTMAELGEL